MEVTTRTVIIVEAIVLAPLEKVWAYWSEPKHITQWTHASDDWHAPYADNDLRKDGKFKTTMAAKDGSFSFDFEGVYSNVHLNKIIEYGLADGRKVKIEFIANGNETRVVQKFDAENDNPIEMQRSGWQAITDNFKKYTEAN